MFHAATSAMRAKMANGMLHLCTPRLELIAATLELAELESHGVARLAHKLGCAAPASWPPPLNDENSQRWFREMLQNDSEMVGWVLWYVVRNEPRQERVLMGNAGSKESLSMAGARSGIASSRCTTEKDTKLRQRRRSSVWRSSTPK